MMISTTMMTRMMNNLEQYCEHIDSQLAVWPLAKENFQKLGQVERKSYRLGSLHGAFQFNPARIVSTGAKISKEAIAARPCFLCKANRPEQQFSAAIADRWELLVNPFPIFPVHFTIAACDHRPQERIPLEIVSFADKLRGLTVFFNGAKAGASAPDHLHLQAVATSELPLMKAVEQAHPASSRGIMSSEQLGDFPFLFYSAVVTPDAEGEKVILAMLNICGTDNETGQPDKGSDKGPDKGLVNAYAWIDGAGMLRMVTIPRKAHRPSCYYAENGDAMLVSPGAIDMAGVVILPKEEDFRKIDSEKLLSIFREVAF